LAIIATRAGQTRFPLAVVAEELDSAGRAGRLDILDAGDNASQIRAVFSWSYQALDPPVARLFRLLGLHPGPSVSLPAAASLAGLPVVEARRLLSELARANLIVELTPGRYTYHDLIRAYATDLCHRQDAERERRAAVTRMLDHYLHVAYAADRALRPDRPPIMLPTPDRLITRTVIPDRPATPGQRPRPSPTSATPTRPAARLARRAGPGRTRWTSSRYSETRMPNRSAPSSPESALPCPPDR
jgi:hypothetical protein